MRLALLLLVAAQFLVPAAFAFDPSALLEPVEGEAAADVMQTLLDDPVLRTFATWFNTLVLAVGTVVISYILGHGIVQTAIDGEFMGKKWSSSWGIIRVITGLGLMFPLPDLGWSGGQYAVYSVSRAGLGAAGNLWKEVADTVGNRVQETAAPTVPAPDVLAKGLLQAATCVQAINNVGRQVGETWIVKTERSNEISFDGARNGLFRMFPAGACGTIKFSEHEPKTPAAKAMIAAHKTAFNALFTVAITTAEQLTRDSVDALPPPDPAPLVTAVQNYRAAVAAAAKSAPKATSSDKEDSFARAATSAGWTGAGSWYMQLTTRRSEISTAAGAMATVLPPKTGSFGSGSGGTTLNRGLARMESWWDETYAPARQGQEGGAEARRLSALQAGGSPLDLLSETTLVGGILSWAHQASTEDNMSAFGKTVGFGHTLLNAAWTAIGVAGAAEVGMSLYGGGAAKKALSFATSGGPLGSILETAGSIFWMVMVGLMGLGALLAYVLPMLPFFHWVFGVTAWLVSVFATMISATVWGLAHINMEGDGLVYARSESGYMMLLNVALTPMLMEAGLIGSMWIMEGSAAIAFMVFSSAWAGATDGYLVGVVGTVIFVALLVILQFALANKSLELIHTLPDFVMSVSGFHSRAVLQGSEAGGEQAVRMSDKAVSTTSQVATMAVQTPQKRRARMAEAAARKSGTDTSRRQTEILESLARPAPGRPDAPPDGRQE